MTYPDPDPHPSGPWGPRTVRDLIAAARRAGADHTVYGWLEYREHVWRTRDWQVTYEGQHHGCGRIAIEDRRAGDRYSRVAVTSPGQAYGVLAALGVIPAEPVVLACTPEMAPAAPGGRPR